MAAYDRTAIYNLALAAIGTRTTVSGPSENSVEVRNLNLQFFPALQSVLQAAHWNFARGQQALALIADATATPTPGVVPTPWLYSYQPPADMVQGRFIMPMFDNIPGVVPGSATVPSFVGPAVRWMISSDLTTTGQQRVIILTNQNQAILVYTRLIDNPALWDSQFADALAHYLGARVAMALTGKTAIRDRAFATADNMVKAAQASNGNEGLTVNDVVPDWIRVRGYQSDWAYPQGSMVYYAPQSLSLVT